MLARNKQRDYYPRVRSHMPRFKKNRKEHALRSFVPEIALVLFWYLVFFPGRMSVDSALTLDLIQAGKSTSTQTAIYFWYLKVFSMNGEILFILSFINILTFYFATRFFCFQMFNSQPKKVIFFRLFLASPFFGFFGPLILHELQFVSGCLILMALLKKKRFSESSSSVKLSNEGLACIGLLLANFRYDGILISLIFIFLFLPKKIFFKTTIAGVFFLLVSNQSALLKVDEMPPGFKFAALVGDIKCVTSDPLVELSAGDMDFLNKLAAKNISKLFEPTTCNYADHGFFVFESFSFSDIEFIKGYLNIAIKNPMLILNAHIERGRQVLPPILFRSPPNMFDFKDDATQFPANNRDGILYTMKSTQTHNKFQELQSVIQSMLNLPAYIINQRSSVWGWGGLWVSLILILNWLSTRFIFREQILIMIAHLGFLFLTIPSISARYVLLEIILGVLIIPHQLSSLGRKLRGG